MSWAPTVLVEELEEKKLTSVTVGEGQSLVLVREGDHVYAIENRCSHDRAPLTGGKVINGMIECPRHGAWFDYKTGHVKRMPAAVGIAAYPVEIRNGRIYVDI